MRACVRLCVCVHAHRCIGTHTHIRTHKCTRAHTLFLRCKEFTKNSYVFLEYRIVSISTFHGSNTTLCSGVVGFSPAPGTWKKWNLCRLEPKVHTKASEEGPTHASKVQPTKSDGIVAVAN